MMRKVIIAVLTLGTVATVLVWPLSYFYGAALVLPHSMTLPNCDVTVDAGRFLVFHTDYIGKVKNLPAVHLSFGGFAFHRFTLERMTTSVVPGYFLFWQRNTRIDTAEQHPRLPSVTWANVRRRVVQIPCWFVAAAFAISPTLALIRGPLRRYRRRRKGSCVECGYNLTGLTEPRCPECAKEFRVR